MHSSNLAHDELFIYLQKQNEYKVVSTKKNSAINSKEIYQAVHIDEILSDIIVQVYRKTPWFGPIGDLQCVIYQQSTQRKLIEFNLTKLFTLPDDIIPYMFVNYPGCCKLILNKQHGINTQLFEIDFNPVIRILTKLRNPSFEAYALLKQYTESKNFTPSSEEQEIINDLFN